MDSQKSNQKHTHTLKDLIIVGSILTVILIANIVIIQRQRIVQTNYWEIPDEESPFYGQQVVIIALEKNFTDIQPSIEIRDLNNTFETMTQPVFWKMENGKYLHTVNFTHWNTWSQEKTYRFLFTFRSWWSPEFKVNESGFFFK